MKVSAKIIENHGINPDEYKKIVKLINREPNLLELGIFSAMWNEHCHTNHQKNILKIFLQKTLKLYRAQVKMLELLI